MKEKFCPFCEAEHDNQMFSWRKVDLCKYDTTKKVEAVAISCTACGRVISVIPSHLFFQGEAAEVF